jgi:hypothetical protein
MLCASRFASAGTKQERMPSSTAEETICSCRGREYSVKYSSVTSTEGQCRSTDWEGNTCSALWFHVSVTGITG